MKGDACALGCALCREKTSDREKHRPGCCHGTECGVIYRAAYEATSGVRR